MKFKVRKVGNSYGIIIPKGFVDTYGGEDDFGKFIEMEFSEMDPETREYTKGAGAIDPPEDFDITKTSTVEEVLAEDDNVVYTEEDNEW